MTSKTPPQGQKFFRDVSQHRIVRRSFLGSSAAVLTAGVVASVARAEPPGPPKPTAEHTPEFFTQRQWAFVIAACDVLIPEDELSASGSEVGVPVFLDRHMQSPYAQGSIWYTRGPFIQDMGSDFGYQGELTLAGIISSGIDEMDRWCEATYGAVFAQLDEETKLSAMTSLSEGEPEFGGVPSSRFFSDFWKEAQVGYFADPSHGGNRNQAGWKAVGYPGVRADFMDWVTVREAYPLPPVDLAGNRG